MTELTQRVLRALAWREGGGADQALCLPAGESTQLWRCEVREIRATVRVTRYGDHEVVMWWRCSGSRWFARETYDDLTRVEAESLLDTLVDEMLSGKYGNL